MINKMRKHVEVLFILCCLVLYGLFVFYEEAVSSDQSQGIAVLGFHHVVRDEEKEQFYPHHMWVDSERVFTEKIRYLYEQGYETWSLDDLYEWRMGRKELNGKVVVLTFDDGYYASSHLIAPILKQYGYCASTFVIGSMLEEAHTWDASRIQYLNAQDMEDQSVMRYYSHTYDLHNKQGNHYAIDVDQAQLQADFDAQRLLVDCSYVAYPYGYYNEQMLANMKQNDVLLAFGYHENRKVHMDDDVYQIPRFAVHADTGMDSFRAMLDSK